MAGRKYSTEYQVGVTADTTDFQQKIQQAANTLKQLGINPMNNVTTGLQQASQSALEFSDALETAINKDTGQFDMGRFNDSIQRSGKSLNQFAADMNKLGPEGQRAFMDVANSVSQIQSPLQRTSALANKLMASLKNVATWRLSSAVLQGFSSAISNTYQYAQELDKSLNNIRIVSKKSAEDMKEFAVQANNAAKALSTTTTTYTDASLIYYQQGNVLMNEQFKEF